mmetsp:Transcript_9246/g.20556  ORF Transcript_9246/g.20556 Transcript_9246/m.20556 type:complete len:662 (-) Transcript_9246:232-2217(-)
MKSRGLPIVKEEVELAGVRSFLISRCGTLEAAFRMLEDAHCVGQVTKTSFVSGIHRLGFWEGVDTVFDTLDSRGAGYISRYAFVQGFEEDVQVLAQDENLQATSNLLADEDHLRELHAPDCGQREVDDDYLPRDPDTPRNRKVVEVLEGSIGAVGAAALKQLDAVASEVFRRLDEAEARLAGGQWRGDMDKILAKVEHLAFQVNRRLDTVEATATQAKTLNAIAEARSEGDPTSPKSGGDIAELREQLDVVSKRLLRVEALYNEEGRQSENDSMPIVGKTFSDDFERNVINQAIAEAKSEAKLCVSSEIERWMEDATTDGGSMSRLSSLMSREPTDRIEERLHRLEADLSALRVQEGMSDISRLSLRLENLAAVELEAVRESVRILREKPDEHEDRITVAEKGLSTLVDIATEVFSKAAVLRCLRERDDEKEPEQEICLGSARKQALQSTVSTINDGVFSSEDDFSLNLAVSPGFTQTEAQHEHHFQGPHPIDARMRRHSFEYGQHVQNERRSESPQMPAPRLRRTSYDHSHSLRDQFNKQYLTELLSLREENRRLRMERERKVMVIPPPCPSPCQATRSPLQVGRSISPPARRVILTQSASTSPMRQAPQLILPTCSSSSGAPPPIRRPKNTFPARSFPLQTQQPVLQRERPVQISPMRF